MLSFNGCQQWKMKLILLLKEESSQKYKVNLVNIFIHTDALLSLLQLWYYLGRWIRVRAKLSPLSASVTFIQTAIERISTWFPHWKSSVNGASSQKEWKRQHFFFQLTFITDHLNCRTNMLLHLFQQNCNPRNLMDVLVMRYPQHWIPPHSNIWQSSTIYHVKVVNRDLRNLVNGNLMLHY